MHLSRAYRKISISKNKKVRGFGHNPNRRATVKIASKLSSDLEEPRIQFNVVASKMIGQLVG